MAKKGRVSRLLRLITLLQSGRARGADDLAAELDVSRRTLFRDLKTLEDAGVPYYYQPGLGYRVSQSFFLPPISLTVPETLGLLTLAHAARSISAGPLRNPTLSAINKLVNAVPQPVREVCAQMVSRVSVDTGPVPESEPETVHFNLLQRCIDEGRVCRLGYTSPSEGTVECELHPYGLHFSQVSWYVLGWTDVHGEVRTFKLERIDELEGLSKRFTRPEDFSVEQKFGAAWRMIPEGEVHDIRLEFSPMVGGNVAEIRWHKSQQQKLLDDGSCLMDLKVDGLREIAWWICGYGQHVTVHKPKALKEIVRQMHTAAAKTV